MALAALVIVIGASLDGDDGNGNSEGRGGDGAARTNEAENRRPRRRTYVVEPGDTLTSIAEQVGVPVERLVRLNPDLDPQALTAGEKVRLRRR